MLKLKHNNCMTVTGDNGTITQPGTCITKDTILAKCDEMQTAINTGHPYQTHLDPHPGPPTDDAGNFIPMEDWRGQPGHIHPPREHQSGGGA